VKLAEHNRIQLVWVQGHIEIDENETAYQLVKQGPWLFPNKFQIVRDCRQSLVKLAEHNRIQLVWAQGHMGIDENEIAYQPAKQGSWLPPTWPWPALGISAKVARGEIKGWMSRKHKEYRQYIHRQRQAKGL